MQPNENVRKTTWLNNVTTGVADVATTLWGTNWKTPTREQIDTLTSNKTRWVWCDGVTTQYVPGCKLIGYKVSGVGPYANNTIFIPAAGLGYAGSVGSVGTWGLYWFNTEDNGNDVYAWEFKNEYHELVSVDRVYGLSVRAILVDNGTTPDDPDNPENPDQEAEYVDLGLPSGTLWATMNLGAKTVYDYGDYFSWGETSPKTSYRWSDYKYGKAEDALTKYCVSPEYSLKGIPDNKTKLEPEDDAATAILGGAWHTPTDDEWKELFGGCYVHREEDRFVLTSRFNKGVLYLPCAGYWLGNWNDFTGMICAYWSSNLYEKVCYDANGITVYDQMRPLHMLRHCGLPVRAVRKADNKQSPSMTEDLNTTLQESQVIKRMVNGQLLIIRDGNAYNMQGQRVK